MQQDNAKSFQTNQIIDIQYSKKKGNIMGLKNNYFRQTDTWGYIAILFFIFVVIMGENIIVAGLHFDYPFYLQGIYIISFLLALFHVFYKYDLANILLFLFTVFVFIYGITTGRGLTYPSLLVAAFFLFINMPKRQRYWRIIAKVLFFFFIFNSLIAFVERISGYHLLGFLDVQSGALRDFTDDIAGGHSFRSVALLGHPLSNALMTTIIMTFVLFSELKSIIKLSFWFICFLGIVCFNARAAMATNAIILIIYIVNTSFSNKIHDENKFVRLLIPIIIMFICLSVYLFTGMGERLKNLGLIDEEGSTQERINTLFMLSAIDTENLVWGASLQYRTMIEAVVGVNKIENYWVGMIFRYGLVIMIPYLMLVFYLFWNYYSGYPKFYALVTSTSFLILSSTNNSLMWTYTPLFVFLICIYIFNPQNHNNIIPTQYKSNHHRSVSLRLHNARKKRNE